MAALVGFDQWMWKPSADFDATVSCRLLCAGASLMCVGTDDGCDELDILTHGAPPFLPVGYCACRLKSMCLSSVDCYTGSQALAGSMDSSNLLHVTVVQPSPAATHSLTYFLS